MKKVIKNIIKKIPGITSIKDTFVFIKEYIYDYKFFKKNYSHSKMTRGKLGYNMLLIVHSLEKGMSNSYPRYFGFEKVKKLIEMVQLYETLSNEKDYPYTMAINVLRGYCEFYETNKWIDREEYKLVNEFLKQYKNIEKLNVGSFELYKKNFIDSAMIDYNSFLSSRHSVRTFDNKKINNEDIDKAINMAIKSPSACNRQMCKIYFIKDKEKASEVIKIGQGFGGFDLNNINIFVITFDVNANYFIGERNQGWFNAGLFSMNFVNALHSLGIGSCFIQFGNSTKQEEYLKKKLNIPNQERIAVIISAGYYKDKCTIPYSMRKKEKDIYKVI